MTTHVFARAQRLRLILPVLLTACAATAVPAATAGSPGQDAVTASFQGDARVRLGQRVVLRGAVTPARAGQPVTLQYAPRGRAYRAVSQTVTAADGAYSLADRPRQSGTLRAVADTGQASRPRRVLVTGRIAARGSRHVDLGRAVEISGVLEPGVTGRAVVLEARLGGRWHTVARARTRLAGRFRAAWRPSAAGDIALRVRFRGDASNTATRLSLPAVKVYRAAPASYYGPGLYGNRTACGQTLRPGLLGVANKSLPCGTRVTFRHRGRSVTVPVIDRGPFVGNRVWDLTAATRNALRFPSTGTVRSTR